MIKLLALRIKSLRENRGWTQSDLERESNIAQAHISRLESGKSPSVSAAVLGQIADALETSVDFLMGRTDSPAITPTPNDPSFATPEFHRLKNLWSRLGERERNAILAMAKELATKE